MTTVCFIGSAQSLCGFEISGHAMTARHGKDILCAAISSAAYLTANTVTEILGIEAEALADDGFMRLLINEKDCAPAQATLRGFELHIKELKKQYPKHIELKYKEGANHNA